MPTYKDSIYTDSNSDTASSDGHDLKHHHTLKDYVIAYASVGFGAIIFVVFLYFYCSPLIKAYRASKAERRRKSLLKPLALSNDSFHTFEEKSYGYGINAPVPVLLRDKVSSKARDNQESRHIVPTLPAGMKSVEGRSIRNTSLQRMQNTFGSPSTEREQPSFVISDSDDSINELSSPSKARLSALDPDCISLYQPPRSPAAASIAIPGLPRSNSFALVSASQYTPSQGQISRSGAVPVPFDKESYSYSQRSHEADYQPSYTTSSQRPQQGRVAPSHSQFTYMTPYASPVSGSAQPWAWTSPVQSMTPAYQTASQHDTSYRSNEHDFSKFY